MSNTAQQSQSKKSLSDFKMSKKNAARLRTMTFSARNHIPTKIAPMHVPKVAPDPRARCTTFRPPIDASENIDLPPLQKPAPLKLNKKLLRKLDEEDDPKPK